MNRIRVGWACDPQIQPPKKPERYRERDDYTFSRRRIAIERLVSRKEACIPHVSSRDGSEGANAASHGWLISHSSHYDLH